MITNGKHKLHRSGPHRIAGNGGFSLFELVVFIISVAIIYAYAANRFAEFPAQAERANFTAILTQLQTGINLELMFGMGGGLMQSPELLEGVNPMELMLSAPANYLGAFQSVDVDQLERRSWYFDRSREELVYLANDPEGLYLDINGALVPTDTLRFKVVAVSRKYDPATGLDAAVARRGDTATESTLADRFGGILLQPVIPYVWGTLSDEEILEAAIASNTQ